VKILHHAAGQDFTRSGKVEGKQSLFSPRISNLRLFLVPISMLIFSLNGRRHTMETLQAIDQCSLLVSGGGGLDGHMLGECTSD
jgi:hypothetical protein